MLAGHSDDLESSNALAVLGREVFDELYPEKEDSHFPVIPYSRKYEFKNNHSGESKDEIVADKYYKYFFENRTKGVGSNNWAVGPAKTRNGNAILCNDPHLSLSLPSIWIEEHIHIPDCNAYGVSFPGFPGIMIGFNEHIAWGETNVGQDIKDLFLVEWANKEKSKYKLDGREENSCVVIKEIKVKNMPSVMDTLRYVDKGIVQMESMDGKSDIAVRWLAVDEQKEAEFMTFIDMMQAKNYEDFKKALDRFNTPAQNFIFASKQGEIALHVNGKFPVRQEEDGRFVERGNVSKSNWDSFIPRSENPSVYNPASNYVTSSNQRSAGTDYPYYYTGKFEHARNKVINDSLSKMDKIDVEGMQRLQSNNFNVFAYQVKPVLLEVLKDKYGQHAIYQKLEKWDCTYTSKDNAPTVYEALFHSIYSNTFEEILQYSDTLDVLMPEDWRLVSLLTKEKNSKIFDDIRTANKETLYDIVIKSFEEIGSAEKLVELQKPWGLAKPLSIQHYTRIPALSANDLQVDGTLDAINAMGKNFGPSWRMIVEHGDEVKAYGVFPGGQSGNPLSKYYKYSLETWKDHKYFKLSFPKDREKVNAQQKIFIN